jgi:hypothetical protein
LGWYTPPEPASLTAEANYINHLRLLAAGAGPVLDGGFTYDRRNSSLAGPFDAADPVGASKTNDTDIGFDPANINVSGWTYLIAKYDGPNAAAMVWLVDGLTSVSVPANWPNPPGGGNWGLSHYSLFNGGQYLLPDGGATLMLMGAALVGLAALRRKFRA